MTNSTQLTRAALQGASPAQIHAWNKEGRLEAIKRGEAGETDDAGTRPEQIETRAELARMSPAEIVAARKAGQLDALQSGIEPTYS